MTPKTGSSEALCQKRERPLPLSFFQPLLAFGLFGVTAFTLYSFPVAKEWLSFGLGVYLILSWRFPWLWLIVIPTLLPVLDLTPWSGRVFFSEFDLLVLSTCAVGYLRRDHWIAPLRFNRGGWILLLILLIWQTYTTLNGLLPLQPLDANAYTSYYSNYNSLRIAKGFFWALLLLPLLGQAIGRGDPVARLLIVGMLGGLIADLTAILWERALFTGLLNFNKPYRVTGLFSGMTTGGAPLDAHLVISLSFVSALFLVWRDWISRLFGLLLLLGSLYALAVTFSRIDYAAIGVSLAVGFLSWYFFSRSNYDFHLPYRNYLSVLIVAVVISAVSIFTGDYIQQRFATTIEDLHQRLDHWNTAISMMHDDWKTKLFGMGKGTFPRNYYWSHPADRLPPSILHISDDGNEYIRMDASDSHGTLFLTQHFSLAGPGPYRLDISLRPRTNQQTRLLIEICERLIFQPYQECRWLGINTNPDSSRWTDYHKTFSIQGLGERYWYGTRPIQISILNRGIAEGIEIDNVQIVTPEGRRLLSNGGFNSGFDHWFLYSGDHLAWHVKNIWVNKYFEGGWVGLCVFSYLIIYILISLFRRLNKGDALPVFFLSLISGLMVVGLFDSLDDVPRVGLLFFLAVWLCITKHKMLDLSGRSDSTPNQGNFMTQNVRGELV